MAQLLDGKGRAITPAMVAQARMSAWHPRGSGRYGYSPGGEARQPALAGWTPALRTADGANAYSRDLTNARVRDLIRTNGTARAAIVKNADMVVGQALKLMSLPDANALMVSREEAMALGKAIEAHWRTFAHDPLKRCDRIRRHQFPGLANLLFREWCQVGESFYVIRKKVRPAWMYSTALHIVNVERMSNPHGMMDRPELRGGIEFDEAGEAMAYHIRQTHPGASYLDPRVNEWLRVPKETSWGRPVGVHGFESEEAEQTRGISPFAAILEAFKMIDRHGHAELQNAVANALFVAFISSSYDPFSVAQNLEVNPTGAARDWNDVRGEFYQGNEVRVGEATLPVLPPGDTIEMNNTARQAASLDAFRGVFLREIASALGVPYIALAEDWKAVTYSSARAALNEIWRSVQSRRASFVEQVITPFFYAFVEELFAEGLITAPAGAPSFWEMPAAYLRCTWIGPGRGYIDRKKEAEGAKTLKNERFTTLRREHAEQGQDWEEELDQMAREASYLAELELAPSLAAAGVPGANLPPAPDPADPDDPDAEDRAELAALEDA